MDDPTASTIRLKDGRRLGYADLGDPSGTPVFYFHGFPSSRLEACMVEEHARRLGVRLLSVDRPGYGLSDDLPGRTISDWPDDVAALADALGLDRFAVVGSSGGAPYAIACAALIPRRLTVAGVVCGLGPPETFRGATEMMKINRLALWLSRRVPWLSRPVFAVLGPLMRRHASLLVRHMARSLSEPDRKALERPEIGGRLARALAEAFRHGTCGVARDGVLYGRPWGVPFEKIEMEVHIFHGELDRIVPASIARGLERRLPRARATYFPDEGHFSVILHRVPEMFEALR